MRYRNYFFLAILAAVPACTADVEGPMGAKSGDALFEEGIKPPPPLGSGDVDISISSPSSETPSEGLPTGGPSAASVGNLSFSAEVHGLYFSNSELTNGWILFLSEECLIASPDAKLQFNERNGKTFGHGTLTKTCGSVAVVLDLSKIQINGGGFGGCEVSLDDEFTCRQIFFTYDGIGEGVINVSPTIIIT